MWGESIVLRMRRMHALGGLFLVCVLIACIALDAWRVEGTLIDSASHVPIAEARVLITVVDESARGILPHTGRSGSRCIRSFVETTDKEGHFVLHRYGSSFMAGEKIASIDSYVQGWYQPSTIFVSTSSALLSPFTQVNVRLTKVVDQRWSFALDGRGTSPLTMDPKSALYQKTMAHDVTAKASLLSASICSYEAWPLLLDVLHDVTARAQTEDERSFLRHRCEEMRETAHFMNRRKSYKDGWRFANEPTYVMPTDCERI
jgi:hypothetical protein